MNPPSSETAPAADHLSALPVELKVQIFSNLSNKDLEACQRTSNHLCAVIKEESNAKTVYRPIQDRNRQRLAESVSQLYDLEGVSLLDALAIWIKQRGLIPDYDRRDEYMVNFLELWTLCQSKPKLHGSRTLADLLELTEALATIHIQNHRSKSDYNFNSISEGWRGFIEYIEYDDSRSTRHNFKRYGINKKVLHTWYHQVKTDPRCLGATKTLHRPQFVLTPTWFCIPSEIQRPRRVLPHMQDPKYEDGICSAERLAELFGLYRVPDHVFNDPGCKFGFCVKFKRAYEIVKRAVQDEEITEEQKALVLEDMYFF